MNENEASCLEQLVQVILEIQFDRIPASVVNQAKFCFADFLGVFCSGSQKQEAQALLESLGGSSLADNPENLALWVGGSARICDLDDGHRFAMGHPGVVVNTAALVCSHFYPVTGKELITAIVRGYEVYCFQGRIINPSAYLKRGFDATSVCGAAAAAATAGTLLKLDRQQLKNAISLAASLCGGLNQYAVDGGSPKYMCAGWGAKLGLLSAQLAKFGMDGPERIFEGRLGFFNGFSPEPNLDRLGSITLQWEIGKAYLKKYSCVRRIHPTLDAVSRICAEHALNGDLIDKITVFGGQFVCDAAIYDPKDMVKAQTSVPYTTALLIQYKKITEHLLSANLNNAAVQELSHRIQIVNDPYFAELCKKEPSLWGATRVEIRTKDGSIYTDEEQVAKGDPENPFSKEEIREKFNDLLAEAGRAEQAPLLWDYVDRLETQKTTQELFLLLPNPLL